MMKAKTLTATHIAGIKVRTNNATEMSEKGQIGGLWNEFYQHIAPSLNANSQVYGVYCHYESDASGDFDVIAATNSNTVSNYSGDYLTEAITLEAGSYLEFQAQGEMPQAIIEAWQAVWSYFEQENSPHQRAYTTDFEHYQSPTSASIFIAIKH